MKINRLLCILTIIGSGIYVSNYGGNIAYALFYLSLSTPLVAFLYTLYVYSRFKIYQSMESYLVVKGDWNDYSFIIANEDYITFRNVKVNFLTDKSTIEDTGQITEYSLLPGEKEILDTRLRCNYRGEYNVGVDSIVVTDFLYLFTITYPLASKLKLIVLPRVVNLEQLGIAPSQLDVKNPIRNSNLAEEELDIELRKYNPGDTRKRVHWKATAKMNELMSRKYQQKPKAEILLFMDLMKVKETELQVIIIEDKIIECILALANYYIKRGTRSQVIYDMEGHREVSIASKEEFNIFYQACAKLQFNAKQPISSLMNERIYRREEGLFYVAVTHMLTNDFYLTALQVLAGGNHLCVLYISNDVSTAAQGMMDSLRLAGSDVYQLLSGDEIEDILT